MGGRGFVSRFSPNRTEPAVLEAIFVQRQKLADVWLECLRESVLTKAKHHLLAVGPRGCGKSHLIALLVRRLRNDPAVREQVRIAWLPEDETTPSFWKFLLRNLRALNAEYGDEFTPPPREELAAADDDHRRAAVLINYLLKKLDGKTLLVVLENLDEVMRGLKDEGQKRWRAFLQEHPVVATLATSQQLTEDVSDRDRPFFGFFQVEHLHPLTADEALDLLRKIAEHAEKPELAVFLQTPSGRARVRAIRHIAGGNHRVFIILSEFATREKLEELVTAFEELLDELTPYYQERLRWLPDQQREIVEFLCRQAQTMQVKHIAAELFMTEQVAASQLKSLKDKGYVTAQMVGRESRYELAEPLMRLSVEVKDPQREPIRLIVEFLRIWYDRAGVEAQLHCLPAGADLERRYFHAALQDHGPGIPGPIEEALDRDLAAARATGDPDEVVRVLVELAAAADSFTRCLGVAYELKESARYPEALAAYERAIKLKPDDTTAWNGKGLVLSALRRFTEALAACEQGIKLAPGDAIAWANKGFLLNEIGRHGEALAACEQGLELKSDDPITWNNKGYALGKIGRHSEALAAYERAIKLNPDGAEIWANKGKALNEIGRHGEALAAYDRVIELDPNNVPAWAWRGWALIGLGRHVEGLASNDQAIEINPKYVPAWNNKAYALLQLRRYSEALAACDKAIEIEPKYLPAWINKGYVLNEDGRYAEALAPFDRAIELDPNNYYIWHYRGRTKLELGQLGGAIADFLNAIKLNAHYSNAMESLAEAYVLQRRWGEAEQALSHRFHLPPSAFDLAKSRLPDLIATIFRASPTRKEWAHRVGRLADIAREVREEWEEARIAEKGTPTPSLVTSAEALAPPNVLAVLSGSLVWSLTKNAYAQASTDALDAWAGVWREAAERHPDLSLATRMFGVGVRYLQTKDERVLLDLVQEERSILRDVFGLDHKTEAG